jgi:hypothetical protein
VLFLVQEPFVKAEPQKEDLLGPAKGVLTGLTVSLILWCAAAALFILVLG